MTTIDAYYFTMNKVNELKEGGIEISIKPSRNINDKDTIEKYKDHDGIPLKLWTYVTFKVTDTTQVQKIIEMTNYLGMCGITFDISGEIGERDWEIDWSFKYTEGKEDWEWRKNIEEVEDIINQTCGR